MIFNHLARYTLLIYFALCCTACSSLINTNCSQASTDGDITEAVQMRLHHDRGINDQDISVSTFERTVTLSGTVANPTQAKIAVYIAKHTPGVKCVISKIKLKCCVKYSEFIGKSSTAFTCGS